MAALVVLAGLTALTLLPARAPAGQSSQATATPVAQVAAGLYHSCAMIDSGTSPPPAGRPVRCWGFSGDGQVGYGNTRIIGNNETPGSVGPVDLADGRTAKALAAGDYHSCAVLDNGSVRCWGYGNEGQVGHRSRSNVGDSETPGSLPPVDLGTGRTATQITAGGNHTCALLDDGHVRCWGLGEFGQLGYGPGPNNRVPNSVGDDESPGSAGPVNLGGHLAKAVTAGAFHTCAILDDDTVRCWGLGSNGQLGYANTAAVLDPNEVGPVNLGAGRTARAITAGFAHTCAVLDDGSVRCWGLNEFGQLGYGNKVSIGDTETPAAAPPADLGPGRTAIAISAGGEHTCAVLDDGAVRCWGSGLFGQLGYASLTHVGDTESPASVGPVDLGPGRLATAVVAGIYHTCARIGDGSVRCWGNGAEGQLGLCSTANVGDDEVPASVPQIDLGAGGAACPSGPAPRPVIPRTGSSPVAADASLAREAQRRSDLRGCLATATRHARRELRRARRLSGSAGARARRHARRHRAQLRRRCLRRHGRTPGRVTGLRAEAVSETAIRLTFKAPASDGRSAPPARTYLVKQSRRPIRSARTFRRAQSLCSGRCRFPRITEVGGTMTLNVTGLRRRTTYYYAVAARDNVSHRLGPRSAAARARTP